MSYTHRLITISVLGCCSVAYAASGTSVDVYVMAGQSNMQGFKSNAAKYPEDKEFLDRQIPFFLGSFFSKKERGSWGQMKAQKGRFPEGHFGPEVTFSRCMLANGSKPFIVKYAFGNTSLADNWKGPGEGGLYDKFSRVVYEAMDGLAEKGYEPRIKGLIWIQGESDAKKDEYAKLYGERLNRLLSDFRFNVSRDMHTPILLGVDEDHPDVKTFPAIVEAQKKMVSEWVNVAFTSMKGLPKADETHLTAESVALQGERVCEDFLMLQSCMANEGREGKCTMASAPTSGGIKFSSDEEPGAKATKKSKQGKEPEGQKEAGVAAKDGSEPKIKSIREMTDEYDGEEGEMIDDPIYKYVGKVNANTTRRNNGSENRIDASIPVTIDRTTRPTNQANNGSSGSSASSKKNVPTITKNYADTPQAARLRIAIERARARGETIE